MSARSAKKSRPQSPSAEMPSATAAHPQRGTVPGLSWLIALIVLAAGEVGLAVYQWSELFTLRGGGDVACSVSEQVNCATVWNSPFASRVHELLGLPVAALGVVWGLTALAVAAILLVRVRSNRETASLIAAVRLVAAVGALSCITFAVASLRSGAVCPTCLGTYVLVLGFAAAAFAGLGSPLVPSSHLLPRAFAWSAVPALLFFLALLVPGSKTPHASSAKATSLNRIPTAAATEPTRPLNEREQQVAAFLETLSPAEQQGLAGALAAYKVAPVTQAPAHQPRRLHGSATSPMRLVEWTDGLCPHCGQLVGRLAELKRVLPPGLMSLEARHFPLAAECNSSVQRPDPTGIRCAVAKAQICLEQAPDYWEVRDRIFAAQSQLRSTDTVLELASSGSVSRSALEACMADPATQSKLDDDIRAALAFNLEGTPLVVVNGKKAMPNETLLYVLALVGGDASSPAFSKLPAPRFGN